MASSEVSEHSVLQNILTEKELVKLKRDARGFLNAGHQMQPGESDFVQMNVSDEAILSIAAHTVEVSAFILKGIAEVFEQGGPSQSMSSIPVVDLITIEDRDLRNLDLWVGGNSVEHPMLRNFHPHSRARSWASLITPLASLMERMTVC